MDTLPPCLRREHHDSSTVCGSLFGWIRRFILFHDKRHPGEMGQEEVSVFLSALANVERVSASTQNQALCALLFLYREVVKREIGWLDDLVRAKRPVRLPVVLTREEVTAVLARLEGVPWLMGSLLYGSGLRLMECARLRTKDVDLQKRESLCGAARAIETG